MSVPDAPMTDPDLFGWRPPPPPARYPDAPGFKEGTTSREAAEKVATTAQEGREQVFLAIQAAGAAGLTPDEAAERIGRDRLYVRPRVSELAREGRLIATGERRRNDTRMAAKVWRAV